MEDEGRLLNIGSALKKKIVLHLAVVHLSTSRLHLAGRYLEKAVK